MARPRLHHTPEAKVAAGHAKWRKYYSKNQDSICRRAREKYRKSTQASSSTTISSSSSTTTSSLSRKIHAIEKKYMKVTGSNAQEYLSGLYSRYCLEPSTSTITKALSPIASLCDDANHIQNRIYMMDGVSLAWKKAEEVCKNLRATKIMIEDILCYDLLGSDEVKEAHRRGELAYQN